MNTNIIKLVAGLAWAAAGLSSAAPVDASLITSQSGAYATCSPTSEAVSQTVDCPLAFGEPEPFAASYRQTIRFIGSGCSAGGCSQQASYVYSDILYGTGRKTTFTERKCSAGSSSSIYGLGSCAC